MTAGLAATVLLALAVAAAAQAVPDDPSTLVLEQSLDGAVVCVSPDAACSAIDLYGPAGIPNTAPVHPGDRFATTVQLRNAGNIAASGLALSPAGCENRPLDGATAVADLCGTVTVTVGCEAGGGAGTGTGGTTFGSGPQTLAAFGQDGTHTVSPPLGPGEAVTCMFTTAYPADGPPIEQAVRAVQPVTWTLVAPEPPARSPSGGAEAAGRPGSGPLAFTGGDALPLTLAGVALLAVGGALHRRSRRLRRAVALVDETAV
ncbi:MAG TPA: hypothetical protein VH479_23760 [Acidimicrobiales bacterium]